MNFNYGCALVLTTLTILFLTFQTGAPTWAAEAFWYVDAETHQRGPDNDRDADTIPNTLDPKPDCPAIYNPKRPDYTNFGGKRKCTEYQSTSPEVLAAIERGSE